MDQTVRQVPTARTALEVRMDLAPLEVPKVLVRTERPLYPSVPKEPRQYLF